MQSEEIKRTVAAGYNQLGPKFAAWAETVRIEERLKYIRIIVDRIPAGEPVLELGCGHGGMTTRMLASRYQLTGIDLAENLLALARKDNPQAEFICADMVEYPFRLDHFAAVVAFYSLFHLPRTELAPMLRKINASLKSGGWFVGCLGIGNHEPIKEPDFLGVEMVSSSFDAQINENLFIEAGFNVESRQIESEKEFGREIGFQWIVARKT